MKQTKRRKSTRNTQTQTLADFPTVIGLVWLRRLSNQIFIMTQKEDRVPQSERVIEVSLCFSFTSALNLSQEKTDC